MDAADPIAPQDGLTQREIHLLGLAASATPTTAAREPEWALERKAETGGLTSVAFGLALRGLIRRGFVKAEQVENHDGEYDGVYDDGWLWIEEHDHLFNLGQRTRAEELDGNFEDDIPF